MYFYYRGKKINYKKKTFNLNNILSILGYKNLEENIFVDTFELKKYIDETRFKDKYLLKYLENEFIEKKLNFYQYVIENNLSLEHLDVFKSLVNIMLNKNDVVLSKKFISFIYEHNIDSYYQILEEIITDFLHDNDISYTLKYYKNNDYDIVLTLENFKIFCILNSKYLRKKYLQGEKIINEYFSYLNDYKIKSNEVKNYKENKKLKNKIEELSIYIKNREEHNNNIIYDN